jgi:hypothetical protein
MATDKTNGERVMFTTVAGLRRQVDPDGRVARKPARLAALLGALALMSVAVNALIVIAGTSRHQSPAVQITQ